MFDIGSLRQIHGKITTLRASHTLAEPPHGLFKVALLLNGNRPVQVRCYGFMENVSVSDPYASAGLMLLASVAGAGKSVLWCVNPRRFL